jgi:hypothetical protein
VRGINNLLKLGVCASRNQSGRPLTDEDVVEQVQASFLHSLKKSMGTAAKELLMSKITEWGVLCECLMFKP